MNTTHSDKTPALTPSAAWVKRRSGSQDATLFILENPFQGTAKYCPRRGGKAWSSSKIEQTLTKQIIQASDAHFLRAHKTPNNFSM